ncbi:hypothetical protein BS47DRAFT_1343238 [Hydnum rufescens UP504]|uniref:Uncharacterized protein n=1 Tax=Hydnum rufescens UP504 TaxID=1448309 RepID=A0A9P6AYP2_9AGAM|nr:hypothetical protein BS47DRAFT_1343238 [Hydnum rufescens UP504]
MTLDASRIIVANCTSLLDAIFTDGFGDPLYATQTQGSITELLRLDVATGFLYAIATISWPSEHNKQTRVTALDLTADRKMRNVRSGIREIIPEPHTALWDHTMLGFRTHIYEHTSPHHCGEKGKPPRAAIICRKRGVLSRRRETSFYAQLFPDGQLQDDVDTMVAAVLLLMDRKLGRRGGTVASSGREGEDHDMTS